jgi:hypothetical protein
MTVQKIAVCFALFCASAISIVAADAPRPSGENRRNVIIFVADGLRAGSVNATDAPTILSIRQKGVEFANSHAVFPTFTMPNGSAIATGHYLGDTGTFSNYVYSGYPIFNTGNFGNVAGTVTPFIEDDQILADLDDHYEGNYVNEESLLAAARNHGYATAAIGKLGPAAIQEVSQLKPANHKFQVLQTVIIDDRTGQDSGIPLPDAVISALAAAGLPAKAVARDQPAGNNTTAGTLKANLGQQQYFADATTKAVLPAFVQQGKPFVLVYWSRDPDGTQHNGGDSLNSLTPGINGPTSRAAVKNADSNLAQILAYINSDPKLASNTDIFVTSDHGFATISKHEVDRTGKAFTSSYAAQFTYKDSTGRQEVNTGFLPAGFLAIDLAHAMGMPLFDPDTQIKDSTGQRMYAPVDPTIPQSTATTRQRPNSGNGLIGGSGRVLDATDAKAIVAANGGSDLIYVPDHDRQRVQQIVAFLGKQDYVGAIFVEDSYGKIPGALPFSSINLIGASKMPKPAIAVGFKTFSLTPGDLQSAVQIADSTLQHGQGMHGSFGRDNTFNTMAAVGPDFKNHFVDRFPVGNADIAVTMAHILGLKLPAKGKLTGRVLNEALNAGTNNVKFRVKRIVSEPNATGNGTIMVYQQVGHQLYFDEACYVRLSGAAENPCR